VLEALTSARRTGGAEGNERLTAMTGSVLLVLLLASLLAGLVIALLTVHLAGNWEQNFG
jgi:hypothetical protein